MKVIILTVSSTVIPARSDGRAVATECLRAEGALLPPVIVKDRLIAQHRSGHGGE
jgi:hypothetical protein